jgi:hypothetical protein
VVRGPLGALHISYSFAYAQTTGLGERAGEGRGAGEVVGEGVGAPGEGEGLVGGSHCQCHLLMRVQEVPEGQQ